MDLLTCKCFYFSWKGLEVKNPEKCKNFIYFEESKESAEKYIRQMRHDAIPNLKTGNVQELCSCWDGEKHLKGEYLKEVNQNV